MADQQIDVLLIERGAELIGLAAEQGIVLEAHVRGENLPSLLEWAGLANEDDEYPKVVLTLRWRESELRFEIPRPGALLSFELQRLRPYPSLLKPLTNLTGLAALAPYHGMVVPIFDPQVIVREHV